MTGDRLRIRKGARVLVDGWGSGTVIQVGVPHQLTPSRWVIVETRRDCRCSCGDRHTVTERMTANFMHVTVIR